jgi:hypothetical protein
MPDAIIRKIKRRDPWQRCDSHCERSTGTIMSEPTIICPNCKTEIKLTESLAAPLIAATRQQFEKQLSQKDAEITSREAGIREKEKKSRRQ